MDEVGDKMCWGYGFRVGCILLTGTTGRLATSFVASTGWPTPLLKIQGVHMQCGILYRAL